MNEDMNRSKSDNSTGRKPSEKKQAINRRQFVTTASAAVAAFSIVPRRVLGGTGYVPPSEKINVGYVGAGTQGIRQLMDALPKTELRIAAVCDPNKDSNNYVAWSRNEIRDKVRAFLKKPNWGQGQRGCRCGREVGREIIDSYYAMSTTSGKAGRCSTYIDYRDMLQNEKDLDAVYIMTPDHLHATVAIAAMNKGKHMITHKTVANVLNEVRLVTDTAQDGSCQPDVLCRGSKGHAHAGRMDSGWSNRTCAGGSQLVHEAVLAAGNDRSSEGNSAGAGWARLGFVARAGSPSSLSSRLHARGLSRLV